MSRTDPLRIVIVGGGASGALMAAHLLRQGPDLARVTIVETRAQLGRGLAYATDNPSHLLNVRAANMSAFPDDAQHFARWLADQADAPSAVPDPEFRFVSRSVYGRYLESLVAGEVAARRLEFIRDFARAVNETPDGVEIALASGSPLQADIAILACGHENPSPPALPYVSPWAEPGGLGASADGTLLILGTGLTMVDTALALEEQNHGGPIVALSRRGLLPQTHRRVHALAIDAKRVPFDRPLSKLLHWLRAAAREADARGQDWRCVMDGLRPHTQSLWRAMPPARRQRFLEHARPWWDIHRHRMAPHIAGRIHDMIARGRLRIIAGKMIKATPVGDGAEVMLRQRGSQRTERLNVARIISCIGVRSDPERSRNALIASLFTNGLARSDPLRVGIEVAPDCAVINAAGQASRRLFAIGPMSQAAFWEIIAVPDIRLQTAELAHRLLPRIAASVANL